MSVASFFWAVWFNVKRAFARCDAQDRRHESLAPGGCIAAFTESSHSDKETTEP
jgi:hypothetical protein